MKLILETPESLEIKLKLLSAARDNCARHYDDHFRTFASLDGKAQATATFAGAQLGLLLALLQKADLPFLVAAFGGWVLVLVVGTLGLLLVVVAASILAMRVRKVPVPFMADSEVEALKDLVNLDPWEADQQMMVNHYNDHLSAWLGVLSEMKEIVNKKATSVFACQWAMVAGLVLATVLLALALLSITS
jgi:hypothetical protein